MALRARQGEVRVHDPARDAARLLPLRHVGTEADGEPRVVLVGAGHAHALVLERWASDRPSGARLTVLTDRTELLYSGMVPGLVAGEYRREELVIDAASLAREAGAELVVGRVERVDPVGRRLHLAGGDSVAYHVASLDLGSAPPPGVSARDADALLAALSDFPASSAVDVVGGGGAGVELAAAIRARRAGASSSDGPVRLHEQGPRLLPGLEPRVSAKAHAALQERGVEVRLGASFVASEDGGGLVIRATGSTAPALLERSGLPVDAEGFVLVDDALRVVGCEELFAAGDCASLRGHDLPKAGVHAVRQAPTLFENLVAVASAIRAAGTADPTPPLTRYEPQSDFLLLLNLGDGTALGTKWGYVVEGRWVRWIKDRIDRRFVERFRG